MPLPRVIKQPASTSGIQETSNLFLRLASPSNANNVPGNVRSGSHIRGHRGCLSTKPGKWIREGMPPSDLASPTCSALKLANFVSPPSTRDPAREPIGTFSDAQHLPRPHPQNLLYGVYIRLLHSKRSLRSGSCIVLRFDIKCTLGLVGCELHFQLTIRSKKR